MDRIAIGKSLSQIGPVGPLVHVSPFDCEHIVSPLAFQEQESCPTWTIHILGQSGNWNQLVIGEHD